MIVQIFENEHSNGIYRVEKDMTHRGHLKINTNVSNLKEVQFDDFSGYELHVNQRGYDKKGNPILIKFISI